MKLKRMISIALSACMIMLTAAMPTYAADPWKGWSMSATSVKNDDGTATVTDKAGSATSMIKYQSFSDSFEVEFSMKVDSFSTETGIQIITGKYRMFMNFAENQITYFTGDGATNVKAVLGYNIGKQMHDYRFSVNGNRANVFIDDNFAGSIIIQTKSDSSPRIQYWVKGTSAKPATLTATVAKYVSNAAKVEVPYDERKEIELDMSSLDEFDVVTEGGSTLDSEGFVRMDAVVPGTAYNLRKYAGIDRDFDYEFRYRLVSSYGESGAQIIWNGHRILVYFFPDYCRVLTKYGQIRYSYGRSVLGEWHDYRVEVRGDYATFYMDGELMTSYELVSWTSDRPYVGFWLNRKDSYYQTTMDIDNIHLIPYTYDAKLEMPINGSKYIAGSDIFCKAKTDAEEVTYYANGIVIGKAGKDADYKLTWNAPVGDYEITAKDSNGKSYDISNISVVPPVKATVSLPEKAVEGTSVEATVSGGSLFDKVTRTELYVDGDLYCSKDGYAKSIAIDGLKTGTHNVFVKCILENGLESVSKDSRIVIESDSLGITVPKSCQVSFKAIGEGKAILNLADGVYGKGFEITNSGDYEIITDSGVYYIYKDGKMLSSGRMDTSNANFASVINEGIALENVKISGAEHIYYYLDTELANGKAYELYNLPQEYSVEFKAKDKTGSLALYDGTYATKLSISEEGVSARTTVGGIGDEEDTLIYKDFKPEANYKVQVSRGIAQLFENNSFVASFRIVEEYAYSANVTGENIAKVTVKSMVNSYSMEENFDSDLDCWNMKSNGWQFMQNGDNGYLKSSADDKRPLLAYGFAKNPVIEVESSVDGQPRSGGFYITARNNTDYAYMYAGYDFKEQSYVVREIYANENKTVYKSKGTFPEKADIKAVFNDNKLELYVNGEVKISTDKIAYIGFGRFGLIADGVSVSVDNFKYKGEGNVAEGIYDITLPDIMNMELTTLADGSLMYLGAYGKNHRSYDGGFTWAQESILPYSTTTKAGNIIKLKSGKYLMMTRCQTGTDKYITQMYLSPDGVSNWEGPYSVEKNAVARVCMNGKVDQMADGRIFYVSVSLAEGIEEHGIFEVYYSDDEGKTWKASQSEFNSFKSFRNLQENKIVGMKTKGHVRLYGRSEYGFIYYCDSYDNGVTWEPEFKASQLIAPMNAFNVRYDQYSDKYYAFWTYDNKNDYGFKQYPRLRVALAVSDDNQKTWNYIMDVDEFEYNTTNFNRFQNLSVDFTKDAIYVNFIRNAPTASSSNAITSRVVRIDRENIKTMGNFPYLHIRNETQVPEVIKALANRSIYTVSGSNVAVINGYRYEFDSPVYQQGDNTILADALDVFLGHNQGDAKYVKVDGLSYKTVSKDGEFIMTKSDETDNLDAVADYLKFAITVK